MKSVAIANTHKQYELTAAELVVRQLSELGMVNLKALFRYEGGRDPLGSEELEAEMEEEEDRDLPSTAVATLPGDQ